jgi:hypothetical protein
MSPPRVKSPDQELRFTRSGQAVVFWIAAAACLMCALVFLLLLPYRKDNPELPSPAWAAIPLALALLSGRIALRCTRHAYLILTPLGIEIFPLFRPQKHLQLVMWNEIDHVETPEDMLLLILHHDSERKSGVVLTLTPIAKSRRDLFLRAVNGRLAKPIPGES